MLKLHFTIKLIITIRVCHIAIFSEVIKDVKNLIIDHKLCLLIVDVCWE